MTNAFETVDQGKTDYVESGSTLHEVTPSIPWPVIKSPLPPEPQATDVKPENVVKE